MRTLFRCAIVLLATLSLAEVSAYAQDTQTGARRPRGPWGINFAVDFGRFGEGPISGQGVTKQGDAPETRTVTSPDTFNVFEIQAEVRFKRLVVAYTGGFGSADATGSAPPGRNGDLFLGIDANGFNGRIFTGFATDEDINKEYRDHVLEVKLNTEPSLPAPRASTGFRFAPYLSFEKGHLDYMDAWRVTEFPDTASETAHNLSWKLFGGGATLETPTLFDVGSKSHFLVGADGRLAYGDYDYESSQSVANPPGPERQFVAADLVSHLAFNARVEAVLRMELNTDWSLDFYGGVGVQTLPTLSQPNGDQLLEGTQNSLEFASPRQYYVGTRLRF